MFPARSIPEFSHHLHTGGKSGFVCKDGEGVSEFKAGNRSQLSGLRTGSGCNFTSAASLQFFKMQVQKLKLKIAC